MKRLQGERELTYLVISHDLSVLRYLTDRIGIMYLGKLVEPGPSHEVYERPAHPYTAALLEAIPIPYPSESPATRLAKGELPSAADPPSGCRFRTRCPRAQSICAEVHPRCAPTTSTRIAPRAISRSGPRSTTLRIRSRRSGSVARRGRS